MKISEFQKIYKHIKQPTKTCVNFEALNKICYKGLEADGNAGMVLLAKPATN